jgi:outer membrane lipoprotein-sorting protein
MAALCLLLVPCASPAAAVETGARALLDHALKTTRDASAAFTQQRVTAVGTVNARGRFEYRKPRHMRLEWTGKPAATAYVNGDTVWYYQPDTKSVLKSSARAGGAPPALFLEESVAVLERTYLVKETGAAALTLAPKEGSRVPWTRVELVLDPATGWPRRLTLVEKGGGSTRLDFERFRINRGIAAARFEWRAPHGVETIDL